jgi:hypothetical protein
VVVTWCSGAVGIAVVTWWLVLSQSCADRVQWYCRGCWWCLKSAIDGKEVVTGLKERDGYGGAESVVLSHGGAEGDCLLVVTEKPREIVFWWSRRRSRGRSASWWSRRRSRGREGDPSSPSNHGRGDRKESHNS